MSSSQSTQASSSSTVGSTSHSDFITSQKRPTTARMHAFSPRKKQRTDETQPPLPTALDQTPHGTVKANIGECPPYNDHAAWIEDAFNNTVYVFGGTRPGDEDCIPTSDFFRCDARTMKWEDLTVSNFFSEVNSNLSRINLLLYILGKIKISRPLRSVQQYGAAEREKVFARAQQAWLIPHENRKYDFHIHFRRVQRR